ncbi:MAG: hypothetical protein KAT39_08670 [Alphaproteobacteria bacterium]|nr:hypothetical protein [Alphaproteobacteria bacterium]
MPADVASSTSPGVMIFILLALAATLYSWWLSFDRVRRLRDLTEWLREHRPQAWSATPPATRYHPSGGIEYLRHHELAQDPEFIERYRKANRYTRRRLAMLLLATAGIAMVYVGTRYLGWVW